MSLGWRRPWISKMALFLGTVFLGLIFVVDAGAFLSPYKSVGGYHHYVGKERVRGRRARKVSREDRERTWQKFLQKYGSGWQVSWNKITGVPHQVIRNTPFSPFSEGLWRRFFENQEGLVELSDQFIKDNAELFQLGDSETSLIRITKRAGIWYVDFEQKYQDIPVYGSRIRFRFDDSYRMLTFGADTYPDLVLETRPLIDESKARSVVREDLKIPFTDKGSKLVIFPLSVEDGVEYFLAWMVEAEGGVWRYFVDARNGQIIQRSNHSRPAISGRVQGMILPHFYNDQPIKVPLRDQQIYLLNKSVPVYRALFKDSNNPGWDTEGLWNYGQPKPANLSDLTTSGHAGPPDPDSGHTGLDVYGYNLEGDYTNLMRPTYLTTHVIDCRGKSGSVLRFWRWLGVYKEYYEDDYGNRTNFDRASVEISYDNGLTWTTIWSNGSGQIEDAFYNTSEDKWYGWNLQAFDISRYADDRPVYIRWGMGSTDGSGVFCGWNIDDVEVLESNKVLTDPNGNFEFSDPNKIWSLNTVMAKLDGKYVDVSNEDSRDAVYVVEDIDSNHTCNHVWDPADPNNDIPSASYDEVNVYYHINKMIQYIKNIDPEYDGMDRKGPIKAITHWNDYYDNAFWSPDHRIYFGEGDGKLDGYRDFALFSDIIYHEYTHAITESFYSYFMPSATPDTRNETTTDDQQDQPIFTTELDAMHEAFSDYWAATLTNDPLIGNGDFWIGHDYVRTLENPFKYPDDYGDDVYANSLILSGAMWDVRQEFGAEVADTLFHFARYGGDISFADYLASVLLQDRVTYGEAHIQRLKEIFGQRGISKAPLAPTRLIATADNTTISLTWEAPDDPDIVGYYVYYRTENDIETSKDDPSVRQDVGDDTSYTVEGLTNETTYVLKVKAYNVYGTESEYSDYVYATPYDPSAKGGSSSGGGDSKLSFCFINAISR